MFSSNGVAIEEGVSSPLPPGLTPESFPGVTQSRTDPELMEPDSLIARGLGLKTYVSVPITAEYHRGYGMLCGASAEEQDLGEDIVWLFESLAAVIARRLGRQRIATLEARAASAERKLADRARFMAEAVHRLKTPLMLLQGNAILLRDRGDELSEHTRTKLTEATLSNVRWLSAEIDALLTEARSEVMARRLTIEPTLLAPLIHETVAAFGQLATGNPITTQVPDEAIASIDRVAMVQILGHLVDNAIKHGPPAGNIWIRVTDGADTVTIDVVDEGSGPDPDQDVFDPFDIGPEDGESPGGIRLGLHIVRQFAEAMGGSVALSRDADNRTAFSVTVPSARDA